MRHAAFPPANEAARNPKLALAKFNAERRELSDQILLRPTPEPAMSPQLPILHNALPQDDNLCRS